MKSGGPALNYLVQMHIGFVFLLVGFVLAARATGLPAGFDALRAYFVRGLQTQCRCSLFSCSGSA